MAQREDRIAAQPQTKHGGCDQPARHSNPVSHLPARAAASPQAPFTPPPPLQFPIPLPGSLACSALSGCGGHRSLSASSSSNSSTSCGDEGRSSDTAAHDAAVCGRRQMRCSRGSAGFLHSLLAPMKACKPAAGTAPKPLATRAPHSPPSDPRSSPGSCAATLAPSRLPPSSLAPGRNHHQPPTT